MSNREAREEIKASILLHNYYYICFKFFLFLSLQSLKINFKKICLENLYILSVKNILN